MYDLIAELIETHEIKSSDDNQLGTISDVSGNRIVMSVSVGRRGKFVVPEKMIDNIRKGAMYLNLTRNEFEKWWNSEGLEFEKEYKMHPDIALGKKLAKKDLEILRSKIEKAFESNFGRETPEEKKEKLFSEQEDVRVSLPAFIREELDSNEWVLRSFELSLFKEDFFVITSKKLVRLKPGEGRWHNWEIPMDEIESISVMSWDRYVREFGKPWKIRGGFRYGGEYPFSYALHIKHREHRRLGHKEVWMHIKEYNGGHLGYEQLESIREFLNEVITNRGKKANTHVAISVITCPTCGHGNPSGAEFCVECGQELK